MLKAVIKRSNIDISGAEPLRACVILVSAFRAAFLEEGCNYKKALEKALMQAEKERKLTPQHPAAADISGAPSAHIAFSLGFSIRFFFFFSFSNVH